MRFTGVADQFCFFNFTFDSDIVSKADDYFLQRFHIFKIDYTKSNNSVLYTLFFIEKSKNIILLHASSQEVPWRRSFIKNILITD